MATEKQPEPQSKISGEYKAIDSRYRRDVALVNARPKLETGGFVLWVLLDIVLAIVFVVGVLVYIVSGSFRDARLAATILDNVSTTHRSVMRATPMAVEVGHPASASVMSGKYDLYVQLENANSDWYTTFEYSFEYDGGTTDIYQGFLNPNERRLLAAINISSERRPAGLRFNLHRQVWHRVDKTVVKDTAEFLRDHGNITVEQASYSQDVLVGEEQFGRSSIVLTNRTAYAYWQPEFLIKLMRGSTIVSLSKIAVPEFMPNEIRTLDVRWFGAVPPSGTISIEPMINYFDAGVYMKPDDETSLDVRR